MRNEQYKEYCEDREFATPRSKRAKRGGGQGQGQPWVEEDEETFEFDFWDQEEEGNLGEEELEGAVDEENEVRATKGTGGVTGKRLEELDKLFGLVKEVMGYEGRQSKRERERDRLEAAEGTRDIRDMFAAQGGGTEATNMAQGGAEGEAQTQGGRRKQRAGRGWS